MKRKNTKMKIQNRIKHLSGAMRNGFDFGDNLLVTKYVTEILKLKLKPNKANGYFGRSWPNRIGLL